MNKLTLIALAPATLALAACGGNDEADTDGAAAGTAETVAPVAAGDMPAVGLDARGTVSYAGTYTGANGSTITLTADDTYTMTHGDGSTMAGDINWYSDNTRILVKDGELQHVFAVADGALFEMADADASIEGAMDPASAYMKNAM